MKLQSKIAIFIPLTLLLAIVIEHLVGTYFPSVSDFYCSYVDVCNSGIGGINNVGLIPMIWVLLMGIGSIIYIIASPEAGSKSRYLKPLLLIIVLILAIFFGIRQLYYFADFVLPVTVCTKNTVLCGVYVWANKLFPVICIIVVLALFRFFWSKSNKLN